MLARLLALLQVPCRGFEIIPLAMQLAQPQVQVRYSWQRWIAVLQGELQRLPVDPARLRKTTPRLREVGRVIGCTGGERDVAGLVQAGDTIGMGLLGCFEVAPRPVRQLQKQSRTAT